PRKADQTESDVAGLAAKPQAPIEPIVVAEPILPTTNLVATAQESRPTAAKPLERSAFVHVTVVDHSHVIEPLITTAHVEALKDVLTAHLTESKRVDNGHASVATPNDGQPLAPHGGNDTAASGQAATNGNPPSNGAAHSGTAVPGLEQATDN